MSSPTPPQAHPQKPGADPKVAAPGTTVVPLSFEERVQLFWHENWKTVIVTSVAVMGVFAAKEAIVRTLDARERSIAAAFTAAGEDAASLRTFVDQNPKHGLGWLATADEAYKAAKYPDAVAAYQKAAGLLASSVFSGRAELGLATSHALAGDKARAEELLKKLSADEKVMRGIRAEATFQLAVHAREAGRFDEARARLREANGLGGSQSMTQRMIMEFMALPPEVAQAAAPAAAPGAAAAPASEIKLNLPAKP